MKLNESIIAFSWNLFNLIIGHKKSDVTLFYIKSKPNINK